MTSPRVVERLRGHGLPLPRPANPLPGPAADHAAAAETAAETKGAHRFPNLLVVFAGHEPVNPVATIIGHHGWHPLFVDAQELRAVTAPPPADAVLLLREVPTGTKRALAAWIRASDTFKGVPIGAITTLVEGMVALPVDFTARPPTPLGTVLDQLLALWKAGTEAPS